MWRIKELKKRSWGEFQQRIVFVRFGSRSPRVIGGSPFSALPEQKIHSLTTRDVVRSLGRCLSAERLPSSLRSTTLGSLQGESRAGGHVSTRPAGLPQPVERHQLHPQGKAAPLPSYASTHAHASVGYAAGFVARRSRATKRTSRRPVVKHHHRQHTTKNTARRAVKSRRWFGDTRVQRLTTTTTRAA